MIKVKMLDTTIPTDIHGYAVSADQSFYDALTTPKGSVVGSRYGTDFHKYKHRSLSTGTLIDMKRCLRDACVHDPRLSFQKAELDLTDIYDSIARFEVHTVNGIITGELTA